MAAVGQAAKSHLGTGQLSIGQVPETAEESTRRRIIGAVLDCILERGFYRASSNEIARRAGITWGAIQYYFGTREKLMLAALDLCDAEFAELLKNADITGDSAAERLAKLATLLGRQYGRPRYLAALQIVLNLEHNPETSQETAAAMVRIDRRISARLQEVIRRAAAGPSGTPESLDLAQVSLLFHAFRGLAVSHLIDSETRPRELTGTPRPRKFDADAQQLARALGSLIEQGLLS